MTVITTMNLDDMNNSNQLNLDWITECLSGLSSLPTSETVEHDKRKNNLGRDNYYSKNNSLEIEEKTGDYFIKYFRHQLTDCLDSLYSINSYQLEALEIIYHLENPVEKTTPGKVIAFLKRIIITTLLHWKKFAFNQKN